VQVLHRLNAILRELTGGAGSLWDMTKAGYASATAAFALGVRGPEWTAPLSGYEAMTIMTDETVLTTGGFPDVDV
jgi:hypothetical protein